MDVIREIVVNLKLAQRSVRSLARLWEITVFKGLAESKNKEVSGGANEGVNKGVNTLRSIITQYPGLRTPLLAKKMQTSTKNVERWLKQLKETKEIEFRGVPKTGGYFLTAKEAPST